MGVIVVNQTDAKQSIILQSTPDGVTGGYYDVNGNWNEFGGTPSGPSYEYTMDDLLVMHASISFSQTYNRLMLVTSDSGKRRSFMYSNGVQDAMLNSSSSVVIQAQSYLYPIPIPEDAKKVTISISPAQRYVGPAFYTWDGEVYTKVLDPGWNEGSYELTFTPGTYEYLTIASKYDSAGNSYPDEPTGLSVVFEKE